MNAFININGEWMFIRITQHSWVTQMEDRDGLIIEPSINPESVKFENGVLSYTTLPGYGNNPIQNVKWQARKGIFRD